MLAAGVTSNDATPPLLELRDVTKRFAGRGWRLPFSTPRVVRALDGVTLAVAEGESVGIVGESGCGKTTLARIALLLERPTSGSVLFRGANVTKASGAPLLRFRSSVQAVFQDPWSSLDPRLMVLDAVIEPLLANRHLSKPELRSRAEALMDAVRLDHKHLRRYPHELSGGQRQRVAIARALALDPPLILLDEPVSSLDVSVRSQVMNVLRDLQEKSGLTYVTIGHHLPSVAYISQRIVVMYLGKVVEDLPAAELQRSRHPYTHALLASALPSHPRRRGRPVPVIGDIPSPYEIPSGCRFRSRCPHAMPICTTVEPPLVSTEAGSVACHLYPAPAAEAIV